MTAWGGAKAPVDRPERWRHKWTAEEDEAVRWAWGVFKVATIAKRLKRTKASVVLRAKALRLGPPGRGLLGITEVSRRLGYDVKAVKRAAERAGVSLEHRRLPSTVVHRGDSGGGLGRWYGLDEDDVEAIVVELRSAPNPNVITTTRAGEWRTGTKPPACLDCGEDVRPHQARGLCGACYKAREKSGAGFGDRPPVNRGTCVRTLEEVSHEQGQARGGATAGHGATPGDGGGAGGPGEGSGAGATGGRQAHHQAEQGQAVRRAEVTGHGMAPVVPW